MAIYLFWIRVVAALLFSQAALIHSDVSIPEESVQYVVAHYKEDLSWLVPYADRAHIYHKGTLSSPVFPVAQWTPLPNVGREGHTYLFHILENYDHLADITFFLQGHIADHAQTKTLDQLLEEARGKGVAFFGSFLPVEKYANSTQLAKYWKRICGFPLSSGIHFYSGACFAVRKERIQVHSKEFYQKMLDSLSHHIHPREGFFVERMWLFLFDPERAMSSREGPLVTHKK